MTLKVAGQSSQNYISTLFDARGEAYFIFENNNPKLLPQLSKVLSIDNVTDTEVYAYANEIEFSDFLEFGIDYKLLVPPSMLHQPVMKSSIDIKSILDWTPFPTMAPLLLLKHYGWGCLLLLCRGTAMPQESEQVY